MRYFGLFGASLALVMSQPALAQVSDAALACPQQQAPKDLAGKLIDAMLDGSARSAAGKALFDQLNAIADGCMSQHQVPRSLNTYYGSYAFDVLMRDELARRLRAAKVPVEALDEALGYGPGRVNPVIREVEQSHVDKMNAATKARGYDLDKAPEQVLRYVGMYVGAQSGLVEDLAELR